MTGPGYYREATDMTGPGHYREAGQLLEAAARTEEWDGPRERFILACAQVHATLATAPAAQLTPGQQRIVDEARALANAEAGGEEALAAFIEQVMNYKPDYGDQYTYALRWAIADIRCLLEVIGALTGGAR